jgi:tetratricopeptide (TPR) repeat protein
MFRAIECSLRRVAVGLFLALSLGTFAGCDRMVTPREAQLTKDADAKAAQGSYLEAINLYEAALDGSEQSADVHYKLGLLYDDKMNDPLNALHHFKRFLTLTPTGKRAEEVKVFMKRDELSLLTNLSGDGFVTRSEAVRLRNENLKLRQQINENWEEKKAATEQAKRGRTAKVPNESRKRTGKERTYTVQSGDTLASISRRFYKTSSRWGRILSANPEILAKPTDLKPGQTLVIP